MKHIRIIARLEMLVSVQKMINVAHVTMRTRYSMRISPLENLKRPHIRDLALPIGINDRTIYREDSARKAMTRRNERTT
jgi:hypothetical protein